MEWDVAEGPLPLTIDVNNRIVLPKHMTDRIGWLGGSGPAKAWLLLISAGRYRLLSDEAVQADPRLEPLRFLIVEGKPEILEEPTYAKEPNTAALVARLVPISITPPKPAWRFSKPKFMEIFAPTDCDPNDFTVFLSVEGYWEIWHTDKLQSAVSVPFPG
jgi:hypothetical protein